MRSDFIGVLHKKVKALLVPMQTTEDEKRMHVSIRHREKTTGVVRRTRQVEVIASVQFSEVEKLTIRMRQLGDFIVMKRQPDSRRAKRLPYLGLIRADGEFDLLVSDLMKGRPDRFTCDTPVHAKAYEKALSDALQNLKAFIIGNTALNHASTFDL